MDSNCESYKYTWAFSYNMQFRIFDKFPTGSDAWGNMTEEITSRFRDKYLMSFVLFPFISEPTRFFFHTEISFVIIYVMERKSDLINCSTFHIINRLLQDWKPCEQASVIIISEIDNKKNQFAITKAAVNKYKNWGFLSSIITWANVLKWNEE